jgi:hypothetical protein
MKIRTVAKPLNKEATLKRTGKPFARECGIPVEGIL